jgi:hypothetical protein
MISALALKQGSVREKTDDHYPLETSLQRYA